MPIQVPRAGAFFKMKYALFSDPSHAWLKVSIEEIKQLGIAPEISGFSYISADRKYAYLEQDRDAQIFLNAVLAADWFEDMQSIRNCTGQYYSDPPSFIRNLDSFVAAQFATKQVSEKNHIYNF